MLMAASSCHCAKINDVLTRASVEAIKEVYLDGEVPEQLLLLYAAA